MSNFLLKYLIEEFKTKNEIDLMKFRAKFKNVDTKGVLRRVKGIETNELIPANGAVSVLFRIGALKDKSIIKNIDSIKKALLKKN